MASSIQSPADEANLALALLGYKGPRIGSLYDGSAAAKKFLDVYSQTRDEVLRSGDWGFAERNILGTLLKQAPAGGYVPPNGWNGANNPPLPFWFEYGYPSDCLKIRAVNPQTIFIPVFNPTWNVFEITNDNYFTPAQKVVCCNVPSAVLVYTAQVTDPTTWEADFCGALASVLTERLERALGDPKTQPFDAQQETAETGVASSEIG